MTRDEALTFARERGVPVPASFDGPYKTDANVWGRSTICSPAQDSWAEPPEDIYALTRSPRDCPDQPAYVEIEFEAGRPLRVNSIEMSPLEMIESLETIAGLHGVGRIDLVATRLTGGQSREIYEAPAAVVLHAAHQELEQLVVPSDLEQVAHALGRTYADLDQQRPVVLADAHRHRRVRRRHPAARHRRDSAQAVQRRLPRGRTSIAVRAIRRPRRRHGR